MVRDGFLWLLKAITEAVVQIVVARLMEMAGYWLGWLA